MIRVSYNTRMVRNAVDLLCSLWNAARCNAGRFIFCFVLSSSSSGVKFKCLNFDNFSATMMMDVGDVNSHFLFVLP